jgi:hypothetical protein
MIYTIYSGFTDEFAIAFVLWVALRALTSRHTF